MVTLDSSVRLTSATAQEYATFYVGTTLMGVDIQQLQEINRQMQLTPVPLASPTVRGVINLRGEVVTVMDLRVIMGLQPTEITSKTGNVIVKSNGEQVALLVDRIADVVLADTDQLEPAPANVHGIEGRFFKGIYTLESELLVILDTEETLASEYCESINTPAKPSEERKSRKN
jgi:purine-binding chemotaxis protein CheW